MLDIGPTTYKLHWRLDENWSVHEYLAISIAGIQELTAQPQFRDLGPYENTDECWVDIGEVLAMLHYGA